MLVLSILGAQEIVDNLTVDSRENVQRFHSISELSSGLHEVNISWINIHCQSQPEKLTRSRLELAPSRHQATALPIEPRS